MRSFIGAFKALSKWIPEYASLIAPLEVSIKGLQDQQRIDCTEELTSHFTQRKKALQSRTTITIPKPLGHLVLTVAASPVNSGLRGTLFIQHDTGQHVAGFFSFKLKEHQRNWLRCDLEALAFTAAAPYIFESHHPSRSYPIANLVLRHTTSSARAIFMLPVRYLHSYLRSVRLMSPLHTSKIHPTNLVILCHDIPTPATTAPVQYVTLCNQQQNQWFN